LQPGLCITPNHFDQQLAFFKQRYQLLSLDDYIDKLSAAKVLPKRSLIITIDDGWRDNYDHAFPILKEHQAPAIVFLTTDYIDNDRQFWFLKVAHLVERIDFSHEDIAAGLESLPGLEVKTFTEGLYDSNRRLDRNRLFEKLKKLKLNSQKTVINLLERLAEPDQATKDTILRSTLTWDEVREMSKAGISFGSHGKSHQIMTLLSPDIAMTELEDSRTQIAAALGREIRHFAYPNGNYSVELARSVRHAGYDSGLTTGSETSSDDGELGRFSIRRIGMHDGVSLGVGGRFSRAMLAFHLARFG